MCGLAFYTGKGKPNLTKLSLLGIYNDSRGGDGVGISFDNKIIKSSNDRKEKLASVFFSKYLKDFEEAKNSKVILIHTRKSTSGHGLKNSHPFGFRKSNKSGITLIDDDKDNFEFIGMHNGTVTNHHSLKREFKLEDTSDMDSKVMLSALYSTGNYEVLSKYEGYAVLVWYVGDDLFVYKGAKFDGTEERTLFQAEIGDGIYFSSIEDSLKAITTEEIKPVKTNTVLHFRKGKLIEETPIKRLKPKSPLVESSSTPLSVVYRPKDSNPYTNKGVYMSEYRYLSKGKRLHGHEKIDLIKKQTSFSLTGDTEQFYFINGILIDTEDSYNMWIKEFNFIKDGKASPIDFVEMSKDFACPACITTASDQKYFFKNAEPGILYYGGKKFSNSIVYPISELSIEAEQGIVTFSDRGLDEFLEKIGNCYDETVNVLQDYSYLVSTLDENQIEELNKISILYEQIEKSKLLTNA
jgi:hypothetical protein